MSVESTVRAVTTYRLTEMKRRGEKIAMLTSYDYSMARIVDAAGIDVILVGDSAANVTAIHPLPVPISKNFGFSDKSSPRTSSINPSVSGRGIKTSGETLNFRP